MKFLGEMKSMNNNYHAATVGYKYIAMRIFTNKVNDNVLMRDNLFHNYKS